MKAQLKTLAIYIVIFGLASCAFMYIKAEYHAYVNSDNHTCIHSYRNANWAHIDFKSVNHHYNWCDAHESDWYQLSNGRVQSEADKLRKAKGWKPTE
jgi:hypothetical protein